MTVYVDSFFTPYKGMKMCHMMADTEPELHEMARRIGVQRRWFHGDHYDICKSKRELAIRYGAKEVTSRFLVGVRHRWWEKYAPDSKEAKKARVLEEMEAEMDSGIEKK